MFKTYTFEKEITKKIKELVIRYELGTLLKVDNVSKANFNGSKFVKGDIVLIIEHEGSDRYRAAIFCAEKRRVIYTDIVTSLSNEGFVEATTTDLKQLLG
jgi:hypothetical protein